MTSVLKNTQRRDTRWKRQKDKGRDERGMAINYRMPKTAGSCKKLGGGSWNGSSPIASEGA